MDIGLHHGAKGLVDEPVSANPGLTLECAGDNRDPEVPATIPGTGVSGMQVTFVFDFEQFRIERRLQSLANRVNACWSQFGCLQCLATPGFWRIWLHS